MPETDNLNGTQTFGPFVRSGLTGGTSYTLKYYWDNGKCYISKQATLSPSSYVYFDIPEGDEYNLKNITLGYTLPQRLTKRAYIQTLRLYASTENPCLLYKGNGDLPLDPEMNAGQGALSYGTWGRTYPITRSWSVGLQATF